MKLEKNGRKWVVKGDGEGWVFNRMFPTKWKAEAAVKVFKKGGRVSDYWVAARKLRPRRIEPWRVLEKVKKALEEIERLDPTCDEIEEYGKTGGHGVVTSTYGENYFGPRLHNKWGTEYQGRVHIDLGCCGYHLMLDQRCAGGFIKFIEDKRKRSIEKTE